MKALTIAGTIGKDAVLRRTQGGDPVTGFTVAVDDGYGQNKSTMWFDCSIWGKRGQALEEHLRKGTKVCATGELGTREHEGKTYLTLNVQNVTLMGGGKQEARQDSPRQTEAVEDTIPF